ncbi:ROK family protein [Gordonia rhizosphera]|uniref:Putative transcriptional regulator n=1 Tax=Gordonia rhizosphera NBRC 16068 TaxID=1108045 RepID=K6WH30_9ACTN|nr:ROK family protein [Gordonia rhizosphera]GAB91467.1 putative transcriptional regulator [Gordonia rhizosphera NBRC 16068]
MRMSRSTKAAATAGDVLALVRDGLVATRSDIIRVTGLSRTAVTARLSALQASGLVLELPDTESTGGRPPSRLAFNADAGVVLAAAIGRSRTQLAVCNLSGQVLTSVDIDQEIGTGPDELMPDLVKRLEALLEDAGRRPDEIRGVGLSIPGSADSARVCSLDSPAMSGWDGVPLTPFLQSITTAPIRLDNDANVIVLSERRGQRDRFDDMLLIKASTGLGAGIVAGGVLQRGAVGGAGQFGHTKIPEAAGKVCRCGDTGCLETVASGWALVRAMREHDRDIAHIRELVDLALAGDPHARQLIRESGRHIGEVLSGAVNLLNPAALVLAGDMAKAYDILVAGLRETVYANAIALATRELQILPSTHGDEAGVIGCAALILDHVLSPAVVDATLP